MNNPAALHVVYCIPIVIALVLHATYKAFRLRSITLIDAAFWLSSLFFGLGPIYVWLRATEYDLDYFDNTGILPTYLNIYLYLTGLMIVQMLSSRNLPLIGQENETPRKTSKLAEVFLSASLMKPTQVIVGFTIALVTRAVLATQYGLGIYASGTAERMGTLPYFWVIMRAMGEVLTMGCVTWAACNLWLGVKQNRRLALAIILLQLAVYLVLMYRSLILAFVIMLALTYAVVKGRLLVRYVLGISLGVYLLGAVIFPAFYSIRTHFVSDRSPETFQRLMNAVTRYSEGAKEESIEAGYSHNLRTRPLITQFNVRIFAAQENGSWMQGRALGASILAVIPRVLYLGADKVFYSSEAYIGLVYFGSMADTSCNWPAVGAADFGVFGGLLYGMLFGLILAMAQNFAHRLLYTHTFVSFCVLATFLNTATTVEQIPETTWAYCRDIAMVYLIAVLISYIFPQTHQQPMTQSLPHGANPTGEQYV